MVFLVSCLRKNFILISIQESLTFSFLSYPSLRHLSILSYPHLVLWCLVFFCSIFTPSPPPLSSSPPSQDCLVSDRPRPLLLIFDRSVDMFPPLMHTSTYQVRTHTYCSDSLDFIPSASFVSFGYLSKGFALRRYRHCSADTCHFSLQLVLPLITILLPSLITLYLEALTLS